MGLVSRLAVSAVTLAFWAGEALPATSPKVDACLKADDFRDPDGTLLLCNVADQEPSLDTNTRAQITKKLGDVFYWSEHFVEAGQYYDKALALDPGSGEARLMKGRVLRRTNNLEEAYRTTMEVVKDEPENPVAIYDAGLIWDAAGEHEKARAFFEAALKIDPDYIMARSGLAQYYNNARQPDRALAEYDAILAYGKKKLNETKSFGQGRLESRDFYLGVAVKRLNLLIDEVRKSDVRNAANALDKLIDEYPTEPYLHVKKAQILKSESKFEAATREVRAANLVCLSKFDNTLCDEGLLLEVDTLFASNKYKEAIETSERVVGGSFTPWTKSNALHAIGVNRKRLGQKNEALDAFLKSIKTDSRQLRGLLTQLSQQGYYDGDVYDPMSREVRNGLEACMVDPECL
jgi:tetratricopeptide (TPR) repeat protein